MFRTPLSRAAAAAATLLVASSIAQAQTGSAHAPPPTVTAADYARAEQLLPWNASRLTFGDEVAPQFFKDGNRFWYRNKTRTGADYVVINPTTNSRSLLFDNARLAAVMSLAADSTYDPDRLPFRAFRFGNLAGTIVSLGEFGLLFALPLFLQAVVGYNAFETGLIFLALAVGSFVAAPLSATLARRSGARRAVTLGMTLEAVGILFTTLLINPSTSGLLLAVPLFVYGVGVGLATAQLTSIVLSDIPPERSGLASGTNSTMRQVGSALGVAILGTVLFATLASQTKANLETALPTMAPSCQELIVTLVDESAGQILPVLRDPGAAGGQGGGFGGSLTPDQAACFADPAFIAALPSTVEPIEDAFTTATHAAGFTALGFVLLGVIFSLLLPDTRHRKEEIPPPDEPAPAATA